MPKSGNLLDFSCPSTYLNDFMEKGTDVCVSQRNVSPIEVWRLSEPSTEKAWRISYVVTRWKF
ncbi:MAG: hypothetical protein JSV99_10535 [Planctomycetota bacterium]|nr:MAG: hypothetical protein JSV99_10535 [Planctomycetota bacterium]